MSAPEHTSSESTVVMDAETIAATLHRIAQEIVAANPDVKSMAFLGILRRGRPLADRLAVLVQEMTGYLPRVGSLATTLYRDDVRSGKRIRIAPGETHFDFNVDGLTVVLVDDVLAAGRTIRAAMDEVMDYGRPQRIQLACLVDRGGRQLPIQPDYLGWRLVSSPEEHVSVHLTEIDDEDIVLLERYPEAPQQPVHTPAGGA